MMGAWLLGRMTADPPWKRHLRTLSCVLIGVCFMLAGANHFRIPAFYRPMMPPGLPAPEALIAISGICEILGGLGFLMPRTRRIAGIGLILLLIAVFPANVKMARHPEQMPSVHLPPVLLWLRLPLQGVLIAWVWWSLRTAVSCSPARTSSVT